MLNTKYAYFFTLIVSYNLYDEIALIGQNCSIRSLKLREKIRSITVLKRIL